MDKTLKENVKKYFKSKNFIISISVCIVALSIGILGAIRVNRILTKQIENITEKVTKESVTVERSTQKVAEDVTGIADNRSKEQTTEKIDIVNNEDFIFPVGKEITADFSDGAPVKSKTLNDWRVHNGIDFKCSKDEDVKAMRSGAVLAIYNSSLWGTIVEIDHGNGIVARYCGLKKGTVPNANDFIEKGTVIGKVGEIPSEIKDGIHLHIEIKKDGKYKDPMDFLGNNDKN